VAEIFILENVVTPNFVGCFGRITNIVACSFLILDALICHPVLQVCNQDAANAAQEAAMETQYRAFVLSQWFQQIFSPISS
jgi:hypothetical protein